MATNFDKTQRFLNSDVFAAVAFMVALNMPTSRAQFFLYERERRAIDFLCFLRKKYQNRKWEAKDFEKVYGCLSFLFFSTVAEMALGILESKRIKKRDWRSKRVEGKKIILHHNWKVDNI